MINALIISVVISCVLNFSALRKQLPTSVQSRHNPPLSAHHTCTPPRARWECASHGIVATTAKVAYLPLQLVLWKVQPRTLSMTSCNQTRCYYALLTALKCLPRPLTFSAPPLRYGSWGARPSDDQAEICSWMPGVMTVIVMWMTSASAVKVSAQTWRVPAKRQRRLGKVWRRQRAAHVNRHRTLHQVPSVHVKTL